MSQNQHFVPRYYFRNFTDGTKHICLILTENGKFVSKASIKDQCSKNYFYGDESVEQKLSYFDCIHLENLRKLIKFSKSNLSISWEKDILLQTVLLQRVRTLLERDKIVESDIKRTNYLYDQGLVMPNLDPKEYTLILIKIAIDQWHLLNDLQIKVIRNYTECPFIFSDSPVVFYNSYFKKIKHRGVLGFVTPGLQIFMPLTSTLQLMLFDPKVYCDLSKKSNMNKNCMFVDVDDPKDIFNLNALQVHHSKNALYFANPNDEQYVTRQLNSHKKNIKNNLSEFNVGKAYNTKNELQEGKIMHTFEPQINYDLSLSFIKSHPVSKKYYFSRR